jgi:hypothetical protein
VRRLGARRVDAAEAQVRAGVGSVTDDDFADVARRGEVVERRCRLVETEDAIDDRAQRIAAIALFIASK